MGRNKYYFGVDIGGTIIKIGLVDRFANVIEKASFLTKRYNSKREIIAQLARAVSDIAQSAGGGKRCIGGLGIGVPGLVDFDSGIVRNLTNMKGWREVELSKIMREKTGLPVLVDNDVNAITQGEFIFGAGKGAENMICIALGTGVGGGIIINRRLYRGSSFTAGEIGHFSMDKNGPRCNCGSYGCLERYIGNRYFTNYVAGKIQTRSEKTKILELAGNDFSKITPEIISRAAKQGDKLACEAWREFALKLGMVTAGMINFLNPDTIVIAGGLSMAGGVLFKPFRETLEKFALKIALAKVKIKQAELKENSGIIGAAALFFSLKK